MSLAKDKMQGTSDYFDMSDCIGIRAGWNTWYKNVLSAVCQGRQEEIKNIIGNMEIGDFRTLTDSYRLVMAAVQYGRVCILRLLLSFGAVVNRSGRELSPLHISSIKGSYALAKCLLEAGADVDMRNEEGKTPLHFSVQAEKIEKELSKFGRTRCPKYYKYLSCALTRLLIQHGASINCMDYSGLTPLHYAVKTDNIDVVYILLEGGANFEMKDRYGRTPLWYAVNLGSKDMVLTLLRAGAKLDEVDELGLTMLHVAVRRENIAMTRFLIQCFDEWKLIDIINKASTRGESCLHFAASCLNTQLINSLLDVGADVNQKTLEGNSALITACFASSNDCDGSSTHTELPNVCCHTTSNPNSCQYCMTVKLLIQKNADINSANLMGETALHVSTKRYLLCVSKILLSKGADVDSQDADKITPVHLAVELQDLVMTKMLLENGADADAKGVEYLTPLHLAVIRAGRQDDKAPELVRLLIDYDADVNARNLVGLTPLHLFLRNALGTPPIDSQIIDTLLQHGANVFSRSDFGQTPFSLACWYSSSLEQPCALRDMLYKVCLFGIKIALVSTGSIDSESDGLIVTLMKLEREHNFYLQCLEEVSSLKSNYVVVDVPFYDLLTLTTERFSVYLRNANFEHCLTQAAYLQAFPIYGPIIQSKFEMASKRKTNMEAGIHFFAVLSQCAFLPQLPLICVEIILKYLRGNDFRNIKNILCLSN